MNRTGPEWPLRIALIALAAFACVQAAFIAYDIGDGALATGRKVSEGLRQVLLTFACGTSSSYFHHVHRLHHLSLERGSRAGSRHGYVRNRYELQWLKRLLAWDGRVFMIGTIALRGFTFRLESIRFLAANPATTRTDRFVLVAHYAAWLVLPAIVLGVSPALLNLALITLMAGAYIGTVLVLNHEGMSRVDEVAGLAPYCGSDCRHSGAGPIVSVVLLRRTDASTYASAPPPPRLLQRFDRDVKAYFASSASLIFSAQRSFNSPTLLPFRMFRIVQIFDRSPQPE